MAHHRAGRLERADALYSRLAAKDPANPSVFYLWGQLAEQRGAWGQAVQRYAYVERLNPAAVPAVTRLAGVHLATGRAAEAELTARRLIARVPGSPEAWTTLGCVLKIRGRVREAIECQEKAVQLNPSYAEGWCHLGLTIGVTGKNHRALSCFDRAIAADAGHVLARFGRAQALHKCYRLEEAIAEYDRVLGLMPAHDEARSYRLFALQNQGGVSPSWLFAQHVEYGRSLRSRTSMLPRTRGRAGTRLRVAILSPDLRTHSCAYFLEPLLTQVPVDRVELYLYHDHFVEDSTSLRLKTHAAVWRNFVGQPNSVVEPVIRADQPDVLIDLTGHVGGGTIRLPLFARRLAPLQLTYLGYPDTTGLDTMDVRFTDAVADPVGVADAFATERLVRFSRCAWTYRPPVDSPEVLPPPAAQGQPVTFACFNSPTKFSDDVLRVWALILAQVPHSRLVLKGRDFDEPDVCSQVLTRMRTCGIEPSRVDLLPRTPTVRDHLMHYQGVDVVLDPFPYHGTTTTCEALWMGRPVVSLMGNRHSSRVGASLLHAVGRPEWVAGTEADYVSIACRLAFSPAALVEVSSGLRAQMRQSVLLDHAGQSARFWGAINEAWQALPPEVSAPNSRQHALSAAA